MATDATAFPFKAWTRSVRLDSRETGAATV